MHRNNIAILLALLMIGSLLPGCGPAEQDVEQLFESDTVINIPLNPEEEETEAAIPETTIPPTEAATQPTAAETQPPKSGSSKSSGSKSTGSRAASGGKTTVKATEPPETQPPETLPPETVSPEAAVYEISDYVPGGLEYAVAEQINACRAEAGLEPLTMDGWLSGVASVRAYEGCVSWSHTRPDGREWQTVLSDYGCGYSVAAEELVHATGFDGAAIVGKWMSAEGSKADILNPEFTTIGVGIYTENETTFLAAILIA